jgi:hypothetical protein
MNCGRCCVWLLFAYCLFFSSFCEFIFPPCDQKAPTNLVTDKEDAYHVRVFSLICDTSIRGTIDNTNTNYLNKQA